MTQLAPLPVLEFFDDSGNLLTGGLLFTYAAGTTTKINTYTDSSGGTPNTNPIVLDSRGDCNCWLLVGTAYKFVLSPSTDTDPPTNPIWTVDNIYASGSILGSIAAAITAGSVTMPVQNIVPVTNTSGAPITINWSASPYDTETHEIIDVNGNASTYPITIKKSNGTVLCVLNSNGQAQIITYSAALTEYLLH